MLSLAWASRRYGRRPALRARQVNDHGCPNKPQATHNNATSRTATLHLLPAQADSQVRRKVAGLQLVVQAWGKCSSWAGLQCPPRICCNLSSTSTAGSSQLCCSCACQCGGPLQGSGRAPTSQDACRGGRVLHQTLAPVTGHAGAELGLCSFPDRTVQTFNGGRSRISPPPTVPAVKEQTTGQQRRPMTTIRKQLAAAEPAVSRACAPLWEPCGRC